MVFSGRILLVFLVVLVFSAFLLAGLFMHGLSVVAGGFRVRYIGLVNVTCSGGIIPDRVVFTFRFSVYNPTGYKLLIKRFDYSWRSIFGGKESLGGGSTGNILLPPHSGKTLDLPIILYRNSSSPGHWDYIRSILSGDVELRYAVDVLVQVIVYYGSFYQRSLLLPYTFIGKYYADPLAGIDKRINIWWSNETAHVGEKVYAYISIKGPYSGGLAIYIWESIKNGSDMIVLDKEFILRVPINTVEVLKIPFTPKAPSGSTVRGYYIEVLVGGELYTVKRIIQPPGYPPRLKVYP